jgi:hypothetical protein
MRHVVAAERIAGNQVRVIVAITAPDVGVGCARGRDASRAEPARQAHRAQTHPRRRSSGVSPLALAIGPYATDGV